MKNLFLILICAVTILTSACDNVNGNKEKEPSTRVPNSVVGKWYDYDMDEGMRIWDFNYDGIYYFTSEKMYGKEDETYEIWREEYSIDGNTIYLDGRPISLEYTSYGFRLIYDSGYEINLYEYREDALKRLSDD